MADRTRGLFRAKYWGRCLFCTRGLFRAKYWGRCLLCDGAIEEGEWIVMDEDSGQYVHAACYQEADRE